MNPALVTFGSLAAVAAVVGMIWMGTYNGLQKKDEAVTGAERSIASCYQKRADVLPNLESVVAKYATHEKDTLTDITNARASVGKLQIGGVGGATVEQVKEMGAAIASQSSALSKLLAVSEAYPNLKADQNFLQLQKDLKGIEQQCALLRERYIKAVQTFNVSVRTFPSNLIAGNHGIVVKEQIKFDDEKNNKVSPRMFAPKK